MPTRSGAMSTCPHPCRRAAEQWAPARTRADAQQSNERTYSSGKVLSTQVKVIFTGYQDYFWQTLRKRKAAPWLLSLMHDTDTQQRPTPVHLILLMFHEFPERRLLRQHFASCALHNRSHGWQTRADPRGDVKVFSLKMRIHVLVLNWIFSVRNFSFYPKSLTKCLNPQS